ncbi:pyridoxal phosphate-dependent transferase [Aspergillus pseudonomiae]|uniref:Pyridoxal phosphate-dependent transferase n=1 Tax=Aspergillus pseudonomiae TaxID=1506151 RepID=A0A5N7D1G6_9EURO|nr:pyridoxal phosphate-dependent transferase [Aspergillus pseudonomiae]KAB8256423.1 pyridoxal phosphate-dependent transferase [Aspergillus pseudonomiae]KAE8400260.1 pyridoxal phosphate-dependent transferase [Aspergillus pseudonomiae]
MAGTVQDNNGRALVVSSCTFALEMAAIVADMQPGDEVIVPSYTYVTTVNAFALRGAVPVFVDQSSPVHYGGLACDMDKIMEVAKRHRLFVCEDAAMACTSTYKGQMLGTIGNVGCLSVQEKKNFTAGGQGGALLVNDPALVERAEILYDNGTNLLRFMRGEVDHYHNINARRRYIWDRYFVSLLPLVRNGYITLPHVPDNTTHNANVFYIRIIGPAQRQDLIQHMASANVQTHPQFMPLHSSPFGRSHGRFDGVDRVTSLASSQILLLPGVVIRELFVFWGETTAGRSQLYLG